MDNSNKKDILKLVIQYLDIKGYKEVANKLEQESSVTLESKEFKKVKKSINEGKFESGIKAILKIYGENAKETFSIIPKIRIRQIYEMILNNFENENKIEIVEFIRKIINSNNLFEKDSTIEKCMSLIFVKDRKDLLKKMKEYSFYASSREDLLEYILNINTKNIFSNSSLLKFLYPKNLEFMIDSVIANQVKACLYHNNITPRNHYSFFEDHLCPKQNIPYKHLLTIERHNEEINYLVLSSTCQYFAAVLRNNTISVYRIIKNLDDEKEEKSDIFIMFMYTIKNHTNQVTSLVWPKNDKLILTGSKDKTFKVFDALTGKCTLTVTPSDNFVSSAAFCDNDTKILTSTLDQKVMLWDLDGHLIESVTSVTVNELLFSNKLKLIILVAPSSKAIILYDYKSKNEIEKLQINDSVVSIALSKIDDGEFLLVNSSNSTPVLTLWNLKTKNIERKYFGHRQERLNTKCAFGGENEQFLICGSYEKEIYIWSRNQTIPISIIKAHSSSVNSAIWPSNSLCGILISCSDDHTIKVFANSAVNKVSILDSSKFDDKMIKCIPLPCENQTVSNINIIDEEEEFTEEKEESNSDDSDDLNL